LRTGRGFRQARWDEPLSIEMSRRGRVGHAVPEAEEGVKEAVGDVAGLIPSSLARERPPRLPELSEGEVVRHFTRLSQMNYAVDIGTYPLGSCTMKYSPRLNESLAALDEAALLHPYQEEETIQGALALMYGLERWIASLTGMDAVSLQPAAGAHGEFTGILVIRAFQRLRGEERDEVLIPDSAHGTNPASAAMGGYRVVVVPSNRNGCVDIEALKTAVSRSTAGLMLTNPNTLGLFERDVREIAGIVHDAGGLLYYDGANMNAILCRARPGDMGFDIAHINLHKTFSVPHGGGGPGSGPVAVKKGLEEFLPVPRIGFNGERYSLDYDHPRSVGRVSAFYGNFPAMVRAYAYILSMGSEGLKEASETAVLNANYVLSGLKGQRGYELQHAPETPRKHEFVLSAGPLERETGVRAVNVGKRMLDHGVHAPSVYFPLVVEEALMVEPTETEAVEALDYLVEVMRNVAEDAYTNPEKVLSAPVNTSVTRLDEVKASHPKTLCLNWKSFVRDEP